MKWYSSTNRYTHASLEALHMAMKNSKKKKSETEHTNEDESKRY